MLTSNTTKNSSTAAINYNAYAKALGIFVMTTGMFLFAKATGYLFPWLLSRKAEEDMSTALITADETQSLVPLMPDTISFNEENILKMNVATENSMPTDPANSEQVQFNELTLLKNGQPKEKIPQPVQRNRRLMTLPLTEEVQINTYTANYQDEIAIGVQSNNNFVITWSSLEQEGHQYEVYAQRFDTNFLRLGTEFRANTYITDSQNSPVIGIQPDDSFVISWVSYFQDGSGTGIYAQRFNASGSPEGSEFRVNTYTNGIQDKPSIGMQPNGNFIIAWKSDAQDGDSYGIYAQHFNSEGAALGLEFRVNTYTAGAQDGSTIAVQPNSNFIIAWESQNGQDGSGSGIYAQRFSADGSLNGSEFRMNNITLGTQQQPKIAAYSNGNFVAAWYGLDQSQAVYDVYARLFDANGIPLSPDFVVNSDPNTGNSVAFPYINVWQSTNEFIVAWSRYTGSEFDRIFARHFNASASPLGLDFQVNTFIGGNKRVPCIGIQPNSNFIIGWESYDQDGDGAGVYARQFQLDLPILITNQLTITEDQRVTFTSTELSATDTDSNNAALIFTANNVMHGHFELSSNPGVSIMDFTQQQITDGMVQFVHDGGEVAPSYEVSVSDGTLSTTPASASITYTPINNAPVLGNNQLTVSEGQTVNLTATMLSATDSDSNNSTLIFTVSNVTHGHFELASHPGVSVINFTQQQITDGVVRFVHDGGEAAPSYEVSVSDGSLNTTPLLADIIYTPTLPSSSGVADSLLSSTGNNIQSSSGLESDSAADSTASSSSSTLFSSSPPDFLSSTGRNDSPSPTESTAPSTDRVSSSTGENTSPTDDDSNHSSKKRLSIKEIIGIGAGGVAVIGIITAIILCRRKNPKSQADDFSVNELSIISTPYKKISKFGSKISDKFIKSPSLWRKKSNGPSNSKCAELYASMLKYQDLTKTIADRVHNPGTPRNIIEENALKKYNQHTQELQNIYVELEKQILKMIEDLSAEEINEWDPQEIGKHFKGVESLLERAMMTETQYVEVVEKNFEIHSTLKFFEILIKKPGINLLVTHTGQTILEKSLTLNSREAFGLLIKCPDIKEKTRLFFPRKCKCALALVEFTSQGKFKQASQLYKSWKDDSADPRMNDSEFTRRKALRKAKEKSKKQQHNSSETTHLMKHQSDLENALHHWEQLQINSAIQRSLMENESQLKSKPEANLHKEAQKLGFECQNVDKDGNCFFHAVEHQLQSKPMDHLTAENLRAKAVAHIIDNMKLYQDAVEGDVNAFIDKLSKGGTWADHLIIQALSRAMNMTIVILQSDASKPIIFRRKNSTTTIYLGYEVGIHYQSLIPTDNARYDVINQWIQEANIDPWENDKPQPQERSFTTPNLFKGSDRKTRVEVTTVELSEVVVQNENAIQI